MSYATPKTSSTFIQYIYAKEPQTGALNLHHDAPLHFRSPSIPLFSHPEKDDDLADFSHITPSDPTSARNFAATSRESRRLLRCQSPPGRHTRGRNLVRTPLRTRPLGAL